MQAPAGARRPGETNARFSSFAEKRVRDCDERQNRRDAGREQAVIAEGMKNEGLQVKKPERRREHDANEQPEERSAFCVTERGKKRGAESGEIGERAQRSERDRTYRRVLPAQHILAAARRNAFRRSTR